MPEYQSPSPLSLPTLLRQCTLISFSLPKFIGDPDEKVWKDVQVWFDSNKRLSPLPSSLVASSVSSDAQAKKTFTGRIELAVDDAEDDGSTRKVGRDLGS
jgi:hypothetical protein